MDNDKLILDIKTSSLIKAISIIDNNQDKIKIYKIGLDFLIQNDIKFILNNYQDIDVFLDLNLPPDQPEMVKNCVQVASDLGIKFISLSHLSIEKSIDAALKAKNNDIKLILNFCCKPMQTSFEAFNRNKLIKNILQMDGFIINEENIFHNYNIKNSIVICDPAKIEFETSNKEDYDYFLV